MARAPPPQNKNKNGRSDSATAAAASSFGGVPYHYMAEKRGGNNKSASVSRCIDHDTFKFNCSEPSKEDPNRPCGKGCCHHRNPNNRKKFMKRRSCKECKKNGEGGQDLCDSHYVDKRSCKICAPRCEEHGKVKAMCRLCRVEEANAVMNLTSLGAGEREKIQMMREEEDTEERLHHQQQKRAKTAKNTDTTIERRKSSNGKATTTTSHSSAEPVEIISVFETMQTLRRPEPTIGEVEWISEDLTTTARVKTISKAHPDFTIDLCRKEGQETQALATRHLKVGEKNVAISYTEKDYGSYQYQLRVRRT